MNKISEIRKKLCRREVPEFSVGDTVKVAFRIQEGDKTRVQAFEGVVIARRGAAVSETFTVRRVAHGVGVERIFPVQSPLLEEVQVKRKGKVRRSKLYYLRKKVGKHARLAERKDFKAEGKTGAAEQESSPESVEPSEAQTVVTS